MEGGLDPKDRISFTNLPPEIRNIIYRLTLVSSKALEIQTLDPSEYHKKLSVRICHRRRAFPVSFDRWRGYTIGNAIKTTYPLAEIREEHVPCLAMLSLNGQIRKDATSIFYGLNTFSFRDMECLVPFMLDRTSGVVKHIVSFKLNVCIPKYTVPWARTPIAVCDAWVQAALDFAQFEDLHLKRLVLDVKGHYDDLHITDGSFNLHSPSTRWIPALRKNVSGLDMLGVNYDCSECTRKDLCIANDDVDPACLVEEHLWNLLAPHMLKQNNDDHDASTLQHRRIFDLRSSEQDDFGSTSESGFESEGESDEEEEEDGEEEEEEEEEDKGDDQAEGEDKGDIQAEVENEGNDHEAEEKRKEGRED